MRELTEAHFAILRRHMVEVIAIHVELARDELGKAALDQRVLAAMAAGAAPPLRAGAAGHPGLPGHAAADRLRQDDLAAVHRRGDDRPPGPAARRHVLEVGTGLGYQTAVLARLVAGCGASRWSRSWRSRPRNACRGSAVAKSTSGVGDGSRGWVGARALRQDPGGAAAGAAGADRAARRRMVLPLGGEEAQALTVMDKDARGRVARRQIILVRFGRLETMA